MRGLILALILVVGVFAVLALALPDQFSVLGDTDIARLVYLLGALVLVASGLIGLRGAPGGAKANGRGPGWLSSALIWAAVFAVVIVLYRGAQIWAAAIGLAGGLTR